MIHKHSTKRAKLLFSSIEDQSFGISEYVSRKFYCFTFLIMVSAIDVEKSLPSSPKHLIQASMFPICTI